MRIFFPLAFAAVFAGWVLYRLLVKKDLKRQLPNLYPGVFFIAVWAALYFFWLR
ncbi:hypothetical protein [Flaviaesturariibacter aridisoli]|uniref:hypothetical protein n=1 Tax=Flaviaesturariibacter aridisoli TaxID=2545761 RepID=UPI001404FF29|nr:hypothetical protein [Flaviaesturariibacter aridisoli]